MANRTHTFKLEIKIDGTKLAAPVFGLIEEAVVDDQLQLPAAFTIRFNDLGGDVIEKSKVKLGSVVEMKATAIGQTALNLLVKGEVTALEGDYSETGRLVVVRGYDPSHRLQRATHTRTWNDVTDDKIVKDVASQAGLTAGQIDSSSITYEHVSQAGVSDWDFLKARARKAGYEMWATDGKLNFRKPVAASGAPSAGRIGSTNAKQLTFGDDLLEFRARLTGGAQVKQVKTRGWDLAKKEKVEGSATGASKSAVSDGGSVATIAGNVKSSDPFIEAFIPLDAANAANQMAAALAEELGSGYVEAEGTVEGNSELLAGVPVSISNKNGVANKFSGKYVLSRVRHVFDFTGSNLGYLTYFEISGRQDRSLLGLASLGQSNGHVSQSGQPVYGLVIGLVTQNDDSRAKDGKKLGRVKVKFPWLDDQYESGWARVVQFGAGPKSGAMFLPEIDDEVLVGFEHGDVQRPFVIGGLYNGVDLPPDLTAADGNSAAFNPGSSTSQGKVKHRGFVSRKGHRLLFDDTDKVGIYIRSSDGKFQIEIKEKDKELHITGDPKIVIEAAQELSLISKKDINIDAKGQLNIKAATGATIKSDAKLDISGATVTVKGDGPTQLQGKPVKIDGTPVLVNNSGVVVN